MLTLVKLGGSLVTDKRVEKTFRREVMVRLADEIAAAFDEAPGLQLIIGHGSGSFGHFAARKANTIQGVRTKEDWRAFADVAMAASELNYFVSECLQSAGIPVWRFQPSASVVSDNGHVIGMSVEGVKTALSVGIVPVVYGDVALDRTLGGTIISTEKLFFYLSSVLPVKRILLAGEVDGVYGLDGTVIGSITSANLGEVSKSLTGSSGVDVTGGMESEVEDMLALVDTIPLLTIRILNGLTPNLLTDTLLGKTEQGTLISAST